MADRAYEQQNTSIIKAQRLLLELISTLNTQVDPDFSHRLTLLYEYMFNRLIEANVSDDVDALREVERLLSDLRTAWAQADREVSVIGQEAPQEQYAVLR
jgi:flagellar protein FliS